MTPVPAITPSPHHSFSRFLSVVILLSLIAGGGTAAAQTRDVVFASDAEAQRTLQVSAADLQELKSRGVLLVKGPAAGLQPEMFNEYAVPQTSYDEFARLRPARVRDGYGRSDAKIEETTTAWQRENDGYWFGKTFYDGEGFTGVGAIGFLDIDRNYSFLTIPELVDWSVSALVVTPDTMYAGLVRHPEGPDSSGGLLRYNRRRRTAVKLDVPGIIHTIVDKPALGAVFLGTSRGLYVVRGDLVTWHHMEPDVSGNVVVVTETVGKP